MKGGGLFETGAGGSAPKHVQQFVEEGHLRWDSLGEFLALAMSIEHYGKRHQIERALMLAKALDKATIKFLEEGKSPSRKVNELDNRGSHFYLALYWAQALAKQTDIKSLQDEFQPLAETFLANEATINKELLAAQGQALDLEGYFYMNPDLVSKAMRPSATLNKIIDGLLAD
jgi:isocitrate dehydrogenase